MKSLYPSIVLASLIASATPMLSQAQKPPSPVNEARPREERAPRGGGGGYGGGGGGSSKQLPEFDEAVAGFGGTERQNWAQKAQQYQNAFNIPRRPPQGEPLLVVRFAQKDPKDELSLGEDLAVMSHLLRKTLAEKFGNLRKTRNVLGVDVAFAPGSQPIRSIYLDGYGALFLLNVDFPVHPPARQLKEEKENRQLDSAWEEAKREYYGEPSGDKMPAYVEAYDEEKVNALKGSLVEALKSAANIRGLNASDSIAICVSGGATRSVDTRPTREAADPFSSRTSDGHMSVGVAGSFLTIHCKKSDVDAFASGKLTSEEFSKAIVPTTYLGSSGKDGTGVWSAR